MNTQFAIQDNKVYVLEVNPRASRTVPFVSKATGVQLAKIAARCMAGTSLAQQGVESERVPVFFNVKESVFPFTKFPGVDPVLSPEMKSTGEVMGVGRQFSEAFAKAMLASSIEVPTGGKAFLSVRTRDHQAVIAVAQQLVALGFTILATGGTQKVIADSGISCERVNKLKEGRPNIVDHIINDEIDLIVNTTEGRQSTIDSHYIREQALAKKVTYTTTLAGAIATCHAIAHRDPPEVYTLQQLHEEIV